MFNRQLFPIRLALSLGLLVVVLDNGCAAEHAESKPGPEKRQQEQAAVKAGEQSNIVAKIGDYVITKEELEKRLMMELRPLGYNRYSDPIESVDVNEVLLTMIAEKAIAIEARKQGYLEREEISVQIGQFRDRKLAGLVRASYLQGRLSELEVTDAEIDKQIKANPKLDQRRAKALLQRQKANRLTEQYYNQLCQDFHLKKISDNFPKAAQIHQRLLSNPKRPRDKWWVLISQVKGELTPEEKNIVLATFDGGKLTLKDWFYTLVSMSPPSRPKNLNTAKGVEQLLNAALRIPIFVAKAKTLELDKDKNFLDQLKEREAMVLLGRVRADKVKDIKEPNEAQMVKYFENNKELFGTSKTINIDQIWCPDLEAARKVKAELEGGKDFEAIKEEYSLQKKGKPFNVYPGNEGIFFSDLWKGEPNQIIGPVKGFYGTAVKWRIVKILEKKPAELKEYSSNLNNGIKWRMLDEKREQILANYKKQLLQKYPYELYADRIKDMDPLDVP